MRAVFHKRFPFANLIFTKLMDEVTGALMADAKPEERQAFKAFNKALHEDHVLGFEDPKDGVNAVLKIFSDFMDAMFWQESGAFGPGTKGLVAHIPPNAGCIWMP